MTLRSSVFGLLKSYILTFTFYLYLQRKRANREGEKIRTEGKGKRLEVRQEGREHKGMLTEREGALNDIPPGDLKFEVTSQVCITVYSCFVLCLGQYIVNFLPPGSYLWLKLPLC